MPILNNTIEAGAFTGYGDTAARYEERQRAIACDAAVRVLGWSRDKGEALRFLDILGLHGGDPDHEGILEQLRASLRDTGQIPDPGPELQQEVDLRKDPGPWTHERVRDIILGWAHMEIQFSANHFYLTLPESAHPLIGPALQSLRRKHLKSVGSEIAVNPARKGSKVTVYVLKRD